MTDNDDSTPEVQQCALPGCDAIIAQPPNGGEPRRYCSAAHRVRGRRLRYAERLTDVADDPFAQVAHDSFEQIVHNSFEQVVPTPFARSTHQAWQAGEPSVVLPPVRRETRAVVQLSRKRGAAGRRSGERTGRSATDAGVRRRRRAIAVLGALSILAASQQVASSVGSQSPASPGGLASSGPPVPGSDVSRAAVERALVKVSAQLDLIAQTEAVWNQWRWTGPQPREVTAMLQQKPLYEQLAATFRSRLTVHDSIAPIDADIAAVDQAVAAIDRTLSTTPTTGPESETVRQGLIENRTVLTERKAKLTELKTQAQRVVAEPVPEVPDATPLTQQVLALGQPSAPIRPEGDTRELPDAVSPRSDSGREQALASTGAPPGSRSRGLSLDDPEEPAEQQDSVSTDTQPVSSPGTSGRVYTPVSHNTGEAYEFAPAPEPDRLPPAAPAPAGPTPAPPAAAGPAAVPPAAAGPTPAPAAPPAAAETPGGEPQWVSGHRSDPFEEPAVCECPDPDTDGPTGGHASDEPDRPEWTRLDDERPGQDSDDRARTGALDMVPALPFSG